MFIAFSLLPQFKCFSVLQMNWFAGSVFQMSKAKPFSPVPAWPLSNACQSCEVGVLVAVSFLEIYK